MDNNENSLQMLVDESLTEVDFVMDYLRLRFNTCYLTIISDPVVESEFGSYVRSSADFCNQILQCIGKKVERAYVKKAEKLEVCFNNNYKIFVSLKPEDYINVEAVTLNDSSGRFWVW